MITLAKKSHVKEKYGDHISDAIWNARNKLNSNNRLMMSYDQWELAVQYLKDEALHAIVKEKNFRWGSGLSWHTDFIKYAEKEIQRRCDNILLNVGHQGDDRIKEENKDGQHLSE